MSAIVVKTCGAQGPFEDAWSDEDDAYIEGSRKPTGGEASEGQRAPRGDNSTETTSESAAAEKKSRCVVEHIAFRSPRLAAPGTGTFETHAGRAVQRGPRSKSARWQKHTA